MPNVAKVLKDEITRLARKESRAALEKAKGVATQHQRDIRTLKEQVAALERQVVALEKQVRKAVAAPQAPAASRQTRFVPNRLLNFAATPVRRSS